MSLPTKQCSQRQIYYCFYILNTLILKYDQDYLIGLYLKMIHDGLISNMLRGTSFNW